MHATDIKLAEQDKAILARFTRHQNRSWTLRSVGVGAEAVWIGRIDTPQSEGWVQLRTKTEFGYMDKAALGTSSLWVPDRGWVETLPLAPYPDAPMWAGESIEYTQRVEDANELVLLATVKFLRTTEAFR